MDYKTKQFGFQSSFFFNTYVSILYVGDVDNTCIKKTINNVLFPVIKSKQYR